MLQAQLDRGMREAHRRHTNIAEIAAVFLTIHTVEGAEHALPRQVLRRLSTLQAQLDRGMREAHRQHTNIAEIAAWSAEVFVWFVVHSDVLGIPPSVFQSVLLIRRYFFVSLM